MIDDWSTEIVKAVIVRQHLDRLDDLFTYPLPEVAASEDEIVEAETVAGALDRSYRTFLGYANGWCGLLQGVDLFGTRQLVGGPLMSLAQRFLAATAHEAFAPASFDADHVIPIGASEIQTDVWLLGAPSSRREGEVLWIWGDGFEAYPNFDEFLFAMVDYNRLALQRRLAKQ